MAPHVQAAIGAVQAKAAPSRPNPPQRQPPACPPPAPCRPGTVQRASFSTYNRLYSLDQPEYPALRFHKNKDWKKSLAEEGKFKGDAYGLRDTDYDPLLRHPLGRNIIENRMSQKPPPPEDYGTHTGYKAGLAATVERAIHRNIMEHTESVNAQGGTVADLVGRLLDAGPLLVVDIGGPAGYERYYSPTMQHPSFGKVGKRVYHVEEVLQDIPMITKTVISDLGPILDQTLDNQTLPEVRRILIGRALESVEAFLEDRYGLPFLHIPIPIPIHVPVQQTQPQRIYNVPPDFDESSKEIMDALAELDDDDPSYLDFLGQ